MSTHRRAPDTSLLAAWRIVMSICVRGITAVVVATNTVLLAALVWSSPDKLALADLAGFLQSPRFLLAMTPIAVLMLVYDGVMSAPDSFHRPSSAPRSRRD